MIANRFRGQTVLVSGAGGLIGAATAVRLAREGARRLILIDISQRKLSATAQEVARTSAECEVVAQRCNVLALSEVQDLQASLGADSPVDALINVVGGVKGPQLYEPLLSMSEERWDGAFELNLKGIFFMVRAFGPGMKRRASGRIVNIASIAFAGDANQPDYSAAKAAVASLTRSLAAEFAPHVGVNCVAPGLIANEVSGYDQAFVRGYVERSLLKRVGSPEEVAAAIAFLASADASFITGAILPVSGGIWPAL